MVNKAALVVVCLVVVAACVWFVVPREGSIPREQLLRPYVCEACGHRFEAMVESAVIECPKCHKKEAVHYYNYECRDCGERLEAFREKTADGKLPTSPDEPPHMLYKRQGGKWVDMLEQLGLERLTCPKCKSRNVGPPRPKAAAK